MTLATISYSLRPPTARFPAGYGKVESLGALAVSGILLSGGFVIGLQAIVALTQQFFPEVAHFLSQIGVFGHLHSHSHDAAALGPNINAAWLAAGSIAIKEWLYRATMKVAIEKRSSVLASNAYHHRVDSLTAFVALLTICASHFLNNAQWLDPIGGLIISGMIVQAGYGNTKAALLELADVGLDEEVKGNVQNAAAEALVGQDAHLSAVQGVKAGQNLLVEIAVTVPDSWTLATQKEVETLIRDRVSKTVKGVKRVAVRFTTQDDGFDSEFVAFDQDSIQEPDEHDHQHEHGHDHEHDHKHENGNGNGTADGGLTKRK